MIKYYPLNQYSMKCSLYPNKTQSQEIDFQMHMIHVYHNNVLYDIKNNKKYCIEVQNKNNPGEVVHFPNFKKADGLKYGMKSKEFYSQYIDNDERMDVIPTAVFSNQTRSIIDDMIRAYEKTGRHPVEQWGNTYFDENGNEIEKGIKYYTKSNPSHSYWIQIPAERIHQVAEKELGQDGEIQYKKNVLTVNIPKVGYVTLRGWNKDIRFDADGNKNFVDWLNENPKKQISCNINRDKCGSYYITFSFGNSKKNSSAPVVWKNMNVPDERIDADGIDVGVTNIAITADGIKFDNIFEHDPKVLELYKKIDYYQEQKSKAWGYANPVFLENYRDIKKANKKIKKRNKKMPDDKQISLLPLPIPSNRYDKLQIKINKCFREIARRKEDYYNKLANKIVTRTKFLGIEGLSVSGMFQDKESNPDKTNKQLHKHNRNLAEASMYMFLSKISYKCLWFETILEALDQYESSTGVCSVCGYKIGKLDTSVREWDCPICHTHHDRDINAAKVIMQKALQQYNNKIKNIA